MKGLEKIVKQLKVFKFRLLAISLLNILSAIFAVFSIAMLAPFLSLIFNKTEVATVPPQWSFSIDSIVRQMQYILMQIVENEGITTALISLVSMIVVCFFLTKIFAYSATWLMAKIRTNILQNYRNKLYNQILILPLSFYSRSKKGDILSRCINDVQEIDTAILQSIQQLLCDPILICFYLFSLAFINWQLTIFVLLVLPIAGLIINRIQRKLKQISSQQKHQQGVLLSLLEESLYGLRVVKSFAIENKLIRRFGQFNDTYNKLYINAYRQRDLSSPMGEFLGTITVVVILLYGSYLIVGSDSHFSAELFITYIAMFSQIINPAKATADSVANLKKGFVSVQRVEDFLAEKEVITEVENAKSITNFSQSIDFQDISFSYEDTEVLKNFTWHIPKGKTVAVCGFSGAGKSTLANLLLRFYDVTKGEILIDGTNIKTLNINSLRNIFGLVSQDSILFNDTIYNNIVLGMENIDYEAVIHASKLAKAYEFIMQTEAGFQTMVGDRGTQLSGGQRQRISIARALLRRPPVLIFDEATSALDATIEHDLQHDLQPIFEKTTVIIIAHRLSTVSNADEIIVLNNGKIIEQGTHSQLLNANGHYTKMMKLQISSKNDVTE
ncbi:MAG: ABC transporter ATP-binding protein/permease [Bacteroidales bacterium]|jgi:subfamily B ATP-binding cassette protein MsbA|nr:ABC transporter ATP-binding protein/permease [Bacteroidales bacterium]